MAYLLCDLGCKPLQPVAWGGVLRKGLEHAVARLLGCSLCAGHAPNGSRRLLSSHGAQQRDFRRRCCC